ncbi:hypothetical protein CRH09_39875 (plasmid) [Nocardia terpenica]|uniref:Uncharacterized protein n=2 Tax=Nocardia terpenica TaxID=455432 RepID=A0A291RY71_9NOCA|nr:hypothetical protein CRH09_39875 [Nocardia terpenica]
MLEKVDLPFPPHVVREIEQRRAAEEKAALDAVVAAAKEAVQERRAEVREAALNGEGRQAAKAAADAAARRRQEGTAFDHRAHWRRLTQAAHKRPPLES